MTEYPLLVIDVGKTNLKVSTPLFSGAPSMTRASPNFVLSDGPYPSFDIDAIWRWLTNVISQITRRGSVQRICVAAHGAGAALIDSNTEKSDDGLILPVMDYEWDGVREFDYAYDELRPDFHESYSPNLPAGLNLARQLYWQSKRFPDEFAAATHILPYAQYWSWRLCGIEASEVSALGSHTDLWNPADKTFSSLVERLNWQEKFAPMRPAWTVLGDILPAVADETGLAPDCKVLTGVHDSNASYARFLGVAAGDRPTVVSTGTWTVCMHPGGDLAKLDGRRDMLANVDVTGAPIACARFMGGREFAEICERTGCEPAGMCSIGEIQSVINDGVFALPDFSGGSGPFGRRRAEISGVVGEGLALANLYAALMIDLELDLLGASGPVVIDGSFAENEMLCRLVAALRPGCSIARLSGADGVAQGCLRLAQWESGQYHAQDPVNCEQINLEGLDEYRNEWRLRCEKASEENDA